MTHMGGGGGIRLWWTSNEVLARSSLSLLKAVVAASFQMKVAIRSCYRSASGGIQG